MEAIQCTENNTEAVTIQTEPNRLLKRNIGELAIDGKLNEDFKSPVRKEVKVSHETHLRRELDQWKELMKERGIRRSVEPKELNDTDPTDFDSILKPDQKNFISEVIDVRQMIQQSHDFRHKFDFFLRVNKLMLNVVADKSTEALDEGKQQALQFQSQFMLCEQFNPVEN
ncbi:uncharacterized protein LOC129574419 [Sitodiplosis mosellana]|uniref:uncharacterized protein LOC129574419 n=1 Tax=Sitodiplosis mosellana TaxID=263140 RepID=UPI0024437AA4|nr:uncharacterized protein LOC129574419 [Sitodiplosis mosellana]